MKYLLFFCLFFSTSTAFSQFVHRSTLIGTGGVGQATGLPLLQGTAVAVSADGNVAVVTSALDSVRGAAWVYLRNGNQWVQAGKKLTPTGFIGRTDFGYTVAISSDGSTIAFGGPEDNNGRGATWIFVRSGNIWVQQGTKLVGTQTMGSGGNQGEAIALSADGNTLAVGGPKDNGLRGGVWFFVRNGTTWTQQGGKYTDSPNFGWQFGQSLAMSADGNMVLIGGPFYNKGAGYIYTRSGSTWNFVQRLIDNGSASYQYIGISAALSANGKIAVLGSGFSNQRHGLIWVHRFNIVTQSWIKEQIITPAGTVFGSEVGDKITISRGGDTIAASGHYDNNDIGAVWMFTHSNGLWSQMGTKITSPITGGFEPHFGFGLSLSGDGKILFIGRPGGSAQGAAFVFSDPSVLSTKQELKAALKFYPNPVKDILHLPGNAAINRITVSDLSGKLLLAQTNVGSQIDLSGLPSGLYVVSLQQQEKAQYVRVVKE